MLKYHCYVCAQNLFSLRDAFTFMTGETDIKASWKRWVFISRITFTELVVTRDSLNNKYLSSKAFYFGFGSIALGFVPFISS